MRLGGIKSLGELGSDEAREGLVYAFDDKRAEVREAATLVLAELPSTRTRSRCKGNAGTADMLSARPLRAASRSH
jgi:HEAT repeat protein